MSFQTKMLIDIEDRLVSKQANENNIYDLSSKDLIEKELNLIFSNVHECVIANLISIFISNNCREYQPTDFSSCFEGTLNLIDCIPQSIDKNTIPLLCEELHVMFLNSSFSIKEKHPYRKKSKKNLIEKGAVYTQDDITNLIVRQTLNKIHVDNPRLLKILDFATGTGRFYRQIAKYFSDEWNIEFADSIVNNIYAVDVDPIAVNICRLSALSLVGNLSLGLIQCVAKNIICKNALIKDHLFDTGGIIPTDCEGLFFGGFDAIVSNPPYLVLKPNKNKMDTATIENINNMAKAFRNSPYYKHSIEGMLNLYQLSLEAMLGMLQNGGEMGIICPSTLFADISASSLRKHLLSKNNVTYIKFFSEDDPLFDNVTQATCIFHLTKGETTKKIKIVQGLKEYNISLTDVKQVFKTNWEIPSIEKVEWDILKKILSLPSLKSQSFIRNKRGELDLSLYRDFITHEPTNLRLVRGNMLSGDTINDINHEYVKPEFLEKKSTEYMTFDYGKKRLVCQQISNQTQKIRLKFVECQKNDVLGNSCNYITVDDAFLIPMKVLLNSALLNWRFKITSTNNHINNYELDELPIIDLNLITSEILNMDEINRNRKICSLYGLEEVETNFIISQYYDTIQSCSI